uniref:Serpin-4A n=1 Tax=Manduca sexta TaxID=7130 RepID=Q6Q2D8_MANSE|nr:serpin-4A [Manduca sexta]
MKCVLVIVLCIVSCYCDDLPAKVRNGLTEKIGNFSIELLYHTSKSQPENQNLVLSPITVWTALAVISEGATGNTRREINHALRITNRNKNVTRANYREISNWLVVKTKTVELAKINAIFVDQQRLPQEDFIAIAKEIYDTNMVPLKFEEADVAADVINRQISNVTHGRIKNIVNSESFKESKMILTSALYFKAQWTVPFNASSTTKMPFHDSYGKKIGEVNMMYNRQIYPFANMRQLQARVIELPYGSENRLSMIIMLPNPGVSVEDMFLNFKTFTLDNFFEEMRLSSEEFGDDEIDCFLPRFKIEADLDMSEVLQNAMGIQALFDQNKAMLPYMARTPMYVSKVLHKAEIEVTEEGTVASGVTIAEFSNRIGIIRYEVNRPFSYIIVEKVTNTIVFGGIYKQPFLY